jgi:hypothetical protein
MLCPYVQNCPLTWSWSAWVFLWDGLEVFFLTLLRASVFGCVHAGSTQFHYSYMIQQCNPRWKWNTKCIPTDRSKARRGGGGHRHVMIEFTKENKTNSFRLLCTLYHGTRASQLHVFKKSHNSRALVFYCINISFSKYSKDWGRYKCPQMLIHW